VKTTARLLIVIAILFLVALIGRGTAEGKQAEAGNSEPRVETNSNPMVPRSWWLAERRKRKRLARYSVRMERQRNALKRAVRSSVRLGASGLERGFLCIHQFEGAWTSSTGNGYYGGLQFDSSFQSTYGPEFVRAFGSANNWTPAMQLAVAERAYLSGRGYSPWPNTRRNCGI
jgi:hypothetical protein